MRHAQNKLTAVFIRTCRKPGLYSDGAGLYLQVSAGLDGELRKSWVYRFKLNGGRVREMGLGSLGVVDLAKARVRAQAARILVSDGIDPIENRKELRAQAAQRAAEIPTFREAATRYIAAHSARWKNEKSNEQWHSSLSTYAYPFFGELLVDRIDVNHILRVLEPIWQTKTVTASRVRGRVQKILDWCASRGLRSGDNPARWTGHLENILPAPAAISKVRHQPALPYAELPAFMQELQSKHGVGARALEFAILTAARTSEVTEAIWGEVDFEAKVWKVPASRMKAKREHRVPLSAPAVALLKTLRLNCDEHDWIFPGQGAGQHLSNMAMLATLKKLRPGFTTHGFRSTFRDWAGEKTDYPREAAEAALAHILGDKVEKAYFRADLFEKRRSLMDDWAAYCSSASVRF